MKKLTILLLPSLLIFGACSNKSSTAKDSSAVETSAESSVAISESVVDTSVAVTDSVSDSTVGLASTVTDSASAPDSVTSSDSSDSSVVVTPVDPSSDSSTAAVAATPDTAPKQAFSQVLIQPGQSTDKFVGAASDVTTDVCKQEGGSWKISGKVKNSSGSAANYRIYVALNRKGSTDTRGLLQVDKSVQDGKTEEWSTTAALADDDLICILRVERTAAK